MRAWTAALCCLSMAACATPEPEDAITTPVTYACRGGKSFTVTYPARGDRAIVAAGGVTKTLRPIAAASGARYAGGGFEIWSQGAQATLSGFPGGPYQGCVAGR